MGPSFGEVLAILISIVTPALLIFYVAKRFFQLKEKKLEIEALNAAEKAAQYVARSSELEQRLAVVERIVTDRPHALAREIDALAIADAAQKRERA
jgi:ABC-type phosphate transport system auxiliary subunit